MEIGKYYFANWKSNKYIFIQNNPNYTSYITSPRGFAHNQKYNFQHYEDRLTNLREATQMEIMQLEESIKLNRYVDISQLNPIYEIY